MYARTAAILPPQGEWLAVIHRIPGRGGEQIDDDAMWDGEEWTRRKDSERVPKDYYYLWRRLATW